MVCDLDQFSKISYTEYPYCAGKRLKDLKSYPSQDGINQVFQDIKNVVQLCFTVNQNG